MERKDRVYKVYSPAAIVKGFKVGDLVASRSDVRAIPVEEFYIENSSSSIFIRPFFGGLIVELQDRYDFDFDPITSRSLTYQAAKVLVDNKVYAFDLVYLRKIKNKPR